MTDRLLVSSGYAAMMPAVVLTGIAVAALLLAEWKGSRLWCWIAKPVASAGFVWAGLSAGATGGRYGRAVLVALLLSFLGDVLLIPVGAAAAFQAGLGSFLLGHVCFSVAFALRGLDPRGVGAGLLWGVLLGAFVLRWLMPHVQREMRGPVLAYVTVISVMVALAAGTTLARGNPVILVAALLFSASDISVARDRFVAHGFINRLWGLPLYYGAQLLFAWTVAAG